MFCGESPAPETQQELPLGALAAGQLSRQGLSPVASARAAGRHLLLLLDAMARYDDLNDWQLGDVLFEDKRTVIASFASATAAGQASPPLYRRPPASPARAPHFSWIRCGAPWGDCSRPPRGPGGPRPRLCRRRALAGTAGILPGGLPWQRCRRKCRRSLPRLWLAATPSSRRRCGTPPRGRTGHTSLSQLS